MGRLSPLLFLIIANLFGCSSMMRQSSRSIAAAPEGSAESQYKISAGIYEVSARPDLPIVKGLPTQPATKPVGQIVKTRPIVKAGSKYRVAKGGQINIVDTYWGKYDLETHSAKLAYGDSHSCYIHLTPITKEIPDTAIRITDETTWVVESSHRRDPNDSTKVTEESCFLLEPARRNWCRDIIAGGNEPVIPDAIIFHSEESPDIKLWLVDISVGGIENINTCLQKAGIEKL